MKITRQELKSIYGIVLPTGKYAIHIKDGQYVINQVKDDTLGCILVGENKVKGQVVNSTATFHRLMPLLLESWNRGEDITIEIS